MNHKIILAICIPIIFIILLLTPYREYIVESSDHLAAKITALLIVLFYAEINIMYGFLALVFVVFFYKIFDRNMSNNNDSSITGSLTKRRLPYKNTRLDVPAVIYQTWYSKDLPPKMKECVDNLIRENPEFDHYLYDDEECRQFIVDNFDITVVDAYDRLNPGAYKADLWRYCILYKKGGIYLDIKFQCEPGFKLIEMCDDTHFVLDRPFSNVGNIPHEAEVAMINHKKYYENVHTHIDVAFWKNKQIGIYNAVMVACPKNPVLLECIQQIVKNVNNDYYGYNPLYPTGPGLLGEKYFGADIATKIAGFQYFNSINGTYILNRKGKKVLSHYPEYRYEQKTYATQNKKYYDTLWKQKDIYMITE